MTVYPYPFDTCVYLILLYHVLKNRKCVRGEPMRRDELVRVEITGKMKTGRAGIAKNLEKKKKKSNKH